MPLTRSDISGLLLAGLKTQFFKTFTEEPSEYEKLCTVIPSDKDTEHYAWLGALPGVREFLDERQVGEFSEYEYQIKNKTWESTVAVERTAIEDDQYGQVALRVKGLAQEAKQHLDQLAFGLLAGGFTTNCYDGTPFFGTHSVGKAQGAATQTNSRHRRPDAARPCRTPSRRCGGRSTTRAARCRSCRTRWSSRPTWSGRRGPCSTPCTTWTR